MDDFHPGRRQVKVTYLTQEGYTTQAYIDPVTGLGTSKHTDIPVMVMWDDDKDTWVQIDKWEWVWDDYKGFVRVDDELPKINKPVEHKRVQPKKQTKSQRRIAWTRKSRQSL